MYPRTDKQVKAIIGPINIKYGSISIISGVTIILSKAEKQQLK
jgi:trehalose-6-phosphate synthase